MAVMLGRDGADEFAAELRRMRTCRGLTQRRLAQQMAYDPSRVSQVESGRSGASEDFARQADLVLGAAGRLLALWRASITDPFTPPERDLTLTDFIAWLADHSGRSFTDLYRLVASEATRLEREPASARHARAHERSRVGRADVTAVLADYYLPGNLATAVVDGERARLGVFTRPEWLAPASLPAGEHIRFTAAPEPPVSLDDQAVTAAVRRLARAEVDGTVMVNNPLYRLRSVDFGGGALSAEFSTVPFAAFALGADMLESEALNAAATGAGMALRDVLLPTAESVFDLAGRPCVGGLAAVVAVARREGDYAVFVQERSGTVVNGAGRLATIPQAFHQPTSEATGEVLLSSTLTRELEEELLGRDDLEDPGRQGDALHDRAASEPMAWLRARGGLRSEVTGLCLNAGAGNYVFSCLVVVEDPGWWDRFGHRVEANWEAQRVLRFSTVDRAGLVALVRDPRWADIGLFTLLRGLGRLGEVGDPGRLCLPVIELA